MGTNYELWKDIAGYEGYYQVSNLGRIKSLSRIVKNHLGCYKTKEKMLKQNLNKNNYCRIYLSKNGIGKMFFVHRLVATTFIPNPNNLPQVNHKDENKTNNFVFINDDGSVDLEKSNLEWCDQKYNSNYGNCIKRRKISFTENHSFLKANATKLKNNSKGAEMSVIAISINDNTILTFKSINEAKRQTGISKGHIWECCSGRRKTAGGYYWKYKI